MFWIVYGKMGSCKTQLGGMADGLLMAVKQHRRVFTNISGVEKKIAGIAEYTGVAPCDIDIVKLTSDKTQILGEVLATLDDKNNNGSLWVLDEIRELFLANKKFNEWLSLRINYLRKNRQDIIIISQLPSYVDDDLKALADGCSYFQRLYKWGIKSYTKENLYNSGQPRLNRQFEPVDPDGVKRRKLDERIFRCYISAIDDATNKITEVNRSASAYFSPKAKFFYAGVFVFIAVVLTAIFIVYKFSALASDFANTGSSKVTEAVKIADDLQQTKFTDKVTEEKPEVNDSLCVVSAFAIGGNVTYKLNNGELVNALYNTGLSRCRAGVR